MFGTIRIKMTIVIIFMRTRDHDIRPLPSR